MLEALHWEHPPLKQRLGEVAAFRQQHEGLRGVLQTVLNDDDRSAVAEVSLYTTCFLCLKVVFRLLNHGMSTNFLSEYCPRASVCTLEAWDESWLSVGKLS